MTARHDEASRLALLKVLGERLKDAKTAADCEIRDTWRPKDRAAAVLPDGTEIGAVTLASGRKKSSLTDETAFEKWVAKTHPEEMETVTLTRPRPEFTERLMSAARQLGEAVDAATGEAVPGITVTEGEAYPTVRLASGAADLLAVAWRDGVLTDLIGSLLPAIEAGERDE